MPHFDLIGVDNLTDTAQPGVILPQPIIVAEIPLIQGASSGWYARPPMAEYHSSVNLAVAAGASVNIIAAGAGTKWYFYLLRFVFSVATLYEVQDNGVTFYYGNTGAGNDIGIPSLNIPMQSLLQGTTLSVKNAGAGASDIRVNCFGGTLQ